jgi:hypothetical protein
MQLFYPTLTDASLLPVKAVLAQAKHHDGYLDRDECPYPGSVKDLLRQVLAPAKVVVDEVDFDEAKPEAMRLQILRLMRELRDMRDQLGSKDHSEKLAYLKLYPVLIEKLIGLEERATNLKTMSEFQSTILQFLDEICDKDQRTELMKRLRVLNSAGETE